MKKLLKRWGKELEWKIRALRSFLSLKDIKDYKEYSAVKPTSYKVDQLIAFFDVSSNKLDRDYGRYAYTLIKDFIESGHQVVIAKRFLFFSSFGRRPLKALLNNEDYSVVPPSFSHPKLDVIISDKVSVLARLSAIHEGAVCVKLDYSYRRATREEYTFPYFPHPYFLCNHVSKLSVEAATGLRPIGVSFVGAYHASAYDKKKLTEGFGIMSRHHIIKHIARSFNGKIDFINDGDINDNFKHANIVMNQEGEKLNPLNYLSLLENSRFFIACPGVSFPISHNITEALLMGCVPILQYADQMSPLLEDGINCLTFNDEESLVEVIERAVSMPVEEWLIMHEHSLSYANKYCRIGSFSKRVVCAQNVRNLVLLPYSIICNNKVI